METVLEADRLTVTLQTAAGPARAVRDLSFSLQRGRCLGIVGESGCGKSMTALAIMGLLPEGAHTAGRVLLHGEDLLALDDARMCAIRGDRIAMIFQEPMTSLNPLHRIGDQVGEALRLHKRMGRREAWEKALFLLERVGIPDPHRRIGQYPHQLSGGQRQRVMIAMALANEPDVLIADEPTTALDVTIQRQILDLIQDLAAETGMGLILISHDLGVIAENADDVLVMYGGMAVEQGSSEAIFRRFAHPYAQGLFAAIPKLGAGRDTRLRTIPGTVPDIADLPPGCPFQNRCPRAEAVCAVTVPPMERVGEGHRAACLFLGKAEAGA